MSNKIIDMPPAVRDLYEAHQAMCAHFRRTGLTFTLDGKLVGDIGEAIVAEAFGINLCRQRIAGVDGHSPDGRTVQIKATGRSNAGPAFSPGEGIADHLIFVRIDFSAGNATVLYNGPEAPVRRLLPSKWSGTRVINLRRVLAENAATRDEQRLPRISLDSELPSDGNEHAF